MHGETRQGNWTTRLLKDLYIKSAREKSQGNHDRYVLWPRVRWQTSEKLCAHFLGILLNVGKKPIESHFCQWRCGSLSCDAIREDSLAKLLKVVQMLLHHELISHSTTSRITWGGKFGFLRFHQQRILGWWISQAMRSLLEILDGLLNTLTDWRTSQKP